MIRDPVSSSRLLARGVRISRTTRSCRLLVKGYETYRARAAFGDRRLLSPPTPLLPAKALTLQAARPFSLRLDVYSPPQVLQIDGCFYHHTPASPLDEEVTFSRAPSLHGRYPASSLSGRRRRAEALASDRRSNGTCGFPAYRFHEGGYDRAAKEGISDTRLTRPISPRSLASGRVFQP